MYLTNVNKDELWDCYINSYPEDERQSHTCNCCRQFIKPYGNVVAIALSVKLLAALQEPLKLTFK